LTGIYLADVVKEGFTENNVIKNNQISGNYNAGIYLGKGVSKIGIISNSIGAKYLLALPLKNQNVGIAIDSPIVGLCIGGNSKEDKNIIAFHDRGIITLDNHILENNPEKQNLIYENKAHHLSQISPEVYFRDNLSLISSYEKRSLQELLEFLIQRNQINEDGILQMRKYLGILPD
jgi:parallel beta-helix repeat protein